MAVRREAVLLELEDRFTAGMARAAGATAALKKELQGLDGTNVKAGRSLGEVERKADDADESLGGLRKTSRESSKEIDKLSGRVAIFRDIAVTLGPALVPLGAAAVPAVVGLAGAFGAAAAGAGVAIAAFNGMGDAMKALDEYQLQPTAKNLQKLQIEMDKLGPAGANFVRFLDSIEPQLQGLQMLAREGLLPGVEDGLTSMLRLMPEARRIVFDLATAMGDLSAEAGDALAGPKFEAFFRYLETDAAPVMTAFAHSVGNVVEGFANLVVAFAPLTRDFNGGLESMTRSFAEWTAGLAASDGFQGFVAYVRENGPAAIDLLAALGNAFVGIIRAAAPLGQAVLPVLTQLAEILAAIANSPLGTPFFTAVAAAIAFNRAAQAVNATLTALKATAIATGGSLTATKVGMAGLALALIDVAAGSSSADKALAGVNTQLALGNLQAAREKLAQVNDQIAKFQDFRTTSGFGDFFSDASKVFTNFGDAYDFTKRDVFGSGIEGLREQAALLEKQINDAEAATAGYATATDAAGGAAGRSKSQIEGLAQAMQEQRTEALSAFDATTRYGEAVDNAAKAAAKGRRGISADTKAGRENRDALSALAAAWNNQGDAVRNNEKAYASARANFVRTATAMGATKEQAQSLARKLLEIPNSKVIPVKVTGVPAARSALDQLTRPRVVKISAQIVGGVQNIAPGIFGSPKKRAAGGTVEGPRAPYGDKVLTMLAPGEEVISNRHGQADRHRALLKAINANRYADGGTVNAAVNASVQGNLGRWLRISDLKNIGKDLREAIEKELGKTFRTGELEQFLKAMKKAAEAALERATAERDAAKQLKDNIVSGLAPDLFPQQRDPFSKGPASPTAILKDSNRTLRSELKNLGALKRRGLDGPALQAILEQNDPRLVQQFAGYSKAQLRQYERDFGINARLRNQIGSLGVKAVTGESLTSLNGRVDRLTRAVERLDRNNQKVTREATKSLNERTRSVGRDATRRKVS